MMAPSAPATAATRTVTGEYEVVCSACGKCGVEFSKRQKNKAIMKGEPARCKSCVDSDTPIQKQQQENQKENTQNEQEEKKEERLYFSGGESVSGESSDDNQDVSLNVLKEQILGRKLVTQQDVTYDKEDIMMVPEISNQAELKKELSCAICQEPFWQPLSLSCGHSFCCECLKWWLERSKERSPYGTCPTCREELACSGESLKVNTALRACVTVLYGEELAVRDQAAKLAKIKATAGENGGAHDRGFEVVNNVGQAWKMLSRNEDEGIIFYARRSIVLDDQDARMQLALAVDGLSGAMPLKLVDDERLLQVSLCLLTMEEDEADDGGFPMVLKDEDDENLICNDFRFHSSVKASFIIDGLDQARGSSGTLLPDVRQPVGPDGTVAFKLPPNTQFGSRNAYIRFVHETCGATYDISYSRSKQTAWQQVDTARENDSLVQEAARSRNAVFLDDEDNDGPNEYEDDGFLVMHEDEVEESASESEDDEGEESEDVCCICREHGELIICDGGNHLEGCGKSFHIHCVRRDQVPPGDWICGDCASTIDLDVGLVGHEFRVDDDSKHKSNKKRVLEDSSGEESDGSVEVLATVSKNKANTKKRSRILESDSEDE
jgi:hypothetical protein